MSVKTPSLLSWARLASTYRLSRRERGKPLRHLVSEMFSLMPRSRTSSPLPLGFPPPMAPLRFTYAPRYVAETPARIESIPGRGARGWPERWAVAQESWGHVAMCSSPPPPSTAHRARSRHGRKMVTCWSLCRSPGSWLTRRCGANSNPALLELELLQYPRKLLLPWHLLGTCTARTRAISEVVNR